MELVEKVAVAIFESDVSHGICSNTWSEESKTHKAQYREDARAAIRAMREPTETMLSEIESALDRAYSAGKDTSYEFAGRMVWQAMIDAALEDEPR